MSIPRELEITFESQGEFEDIADHTRLRDWIRKIVDEEKHHIERIAYFFISDDALLKMNQEYLEHDTLTDILTFPYSYDPISADIYISYERVAENAIAHDSKMDEELRRVVIHGVLHMCGWKDTTRNDKLKMRQREDECLLLWRAA